VSGAAAAAPAGIGEVGERADLVAALVERAVATIPFYAAHLRGARADDLAALPSCSKEDLRAWGHRPLAATGDRPARFCATSGTTGARMLVGFSSADWERLGAQLGRRAAVVGLGPGDLLANTHGYGLWIGGPSLDLMAARAGAALLPLGPGSADQLVTWMEQLPITAMSATPSFLRVLAERVRAAGVDTSAWRLRLGLVGGEGASIELRRECARWFGDAFRWQELYGASEVGGPTLGWSPPHDPLAGRLLVDTEEFVVELLHPGRDEPVVDGEVGEITVTTPHREVDPLVRYRTRDLTVRDTSAADPSGFPAVRALLGRVDDAIKVRGALVYPAAIEAAVVGACAPGAEWRIVVEREPGRHDVLTVVVEHDEPDAGGLAERVHDRIGVRTEVQVVAPGSLPRSDGKSARVTDLR